MIKQYLDPVISGKNLSFDEAQQAMTVIMSGQATNAQIGAFLVALRLKGETSEEIAGFAAGMRRQATGIDCSALGAVDTCGTGGDQSGTFNVSTTAAFVLAGAGVPVAKHGNRGISSSCGSADVLTALGVAVELTPKAVETSIKTLNIGFLYAPVFHQAMKYAAGPRRELGIRTVFNLLGPLTNPANVDRQVVGVYDRQVTGTVAQALAELGTKRAMVVHSHDGLDEISTFAPTEVAEVKGGKVVQYVIDPQDYGFQRGSREEYQGGTPEENAQITLEILKGKEGAKRDIVLMNAAAAFMVAGQAEDLNAGLALARESLDSGAALHKLTELRTFSQEASR